MTHYKLKNKTVEAMELTENNCLFYLDVFTSEITEHKPKGKYKKVVDFHNNGYELPLSDNKLHAVIQNNKLDNILRGDPREKAYQEFESGDYLVREFTENNSVLIYVVRKELFEYLFEAV